MIDIPTTVRISFKALKRNKMRSALTMLGIIIGVGAVIAMIAVGAGAREKIASQISSMGSNLIMVLPGATTAGGVRMGSGTQPTLTLNDAEAIQKECPAVSEVAPILNGVAQVVHGSQNWATGVIGTTPGMLTVREWPLDSGRSFTQQDVRNATKVCLIGKTVVDNLFGDDDPIGKVVRIKKVPFTVIGVLSVKGQSPQGQDQDDAIHVPVTTAQKKLFGTAFPGMVRTIMVKARSTGDLASAEKQIIELLRQRHHIGQKQENDFTVRNLTQAMQTAEQSANVMGLLLGSIASVSLLVGGIGIMNIMLASVLERTREIGIRRALGARKKDIMYQFLTEAVMISITGGLIGVILGLTISIIITFLSDITTGVALYSIIIAFLFSVIVGINFGYLPAKKAASLEPVESIRYE